MTGKKPKHREQYVIRLKNGESISVSREVYLCWYAGARQERYQAEKDEKQNVCSYDELQQFYQDGKAGENSLISKDNVAEQAVQELMIQRLRMEIKQLQADKQDLIRALYFEDKTLRGYAGQLGVSLKAVQKRRDKILCQLKKALEG